MFSTKSDLFEILFSSLESLSWYTFIHLNVCSSRKKRHLLFFSGSPRSEGVRSSALDMFYFRESTFDFLMKKISKTIFVEKNRSILFFEETIFFPIGKSIFLCIFSSKNRSIFFDENGFRDFFFKNRKYTSQSKTYPKQSF